MMVRGGRMKETSGGRGSASEAEQGAGDEGRNEEREGERSRLRSGSMKEQGRDGPNRRESEKWESANRDTTGKPFGHCLRSVAVGCDHVSLHRNLQRRRRTCLLTFTTTSSSPVLSLHRSHTYSSNSAVWCLSAFSMCWVELSDFCRLVKCNHSFLPYSSITAHTNGMPTVQKKKKAGLLLCLCVCLCALMGSYCHALCWSGLINDWSRFECSCVKVVVCVFLCVFDHVRVFVFPRRSAVYFFASAAFFFSLQITRKVEMGLSRQPQIRAECSLQLIAVTLSFEACIFCLIGILIYFFGDDLLQPV